MTAMIKGVLMVSKAKVPMTSSKVLRKVDIVIGIMESTRSVSFANRLVILPRGVVSKKLRGDRRMLCKRPKWRISDARTLPTARIRELMRTRRAEGQGQSNN